MALPLAPGLVPSEVAFLCEMELVTVVPRQKLESIDLLSVSSSSCHDLISWLNIVCAGLNTCTPTTVPLKPATMARSPPQETTSCQHRAAGMAPSRLITRHNPPREERQPGRLLTTSATPCPCRCCRQRPPNTRHHQAIPAFRRLVHHRSTTSRATISLV